MAARCGYSSNQVGRYKTNLYGTAEWENGTEAAPWTAIVAVCKQAAHRSQGQHCQAIYRFCLLCLDYWPNPKLAAPFAFPSRLLPFPSSKHDLREMSVLST